LFEASSAVTVKLKGVPAEAFAGTVTEKCVATVEPVEPPPQELRKLRRHKPHTEIRYFFMLSSSRKERTGAHYKARNPARNYNEKRLFFADKSVWKEPDSCVRLSENSNSRIMRGLHGSASVA
jgi:hypothetical protein